MSADALGPGIYGKLPVRGDFIQRDMPRVFVEPWDEWLQHGLTQSREQLGQDWLRYYLNSPLWRFAIGPDTCGESPMTGVLMPSVDRVGRYFPLTVATPLAHDTDLVALLQSDRDWFERVEQLMLTGLEDDLDMDAFLNQVQILGRPMVVKGAAPAKLTGRQWHCALPGLDALEQVVPQLLSALLAQWLPGTTLWWTHGSRDIEACLLLCSGLPKSNGFAALLTGDWSDSDWSRIEVADVII